MTRQMTRGMCLGGGRGLVLLDSRVGGGSVGGARGVTGCPIVGAMTWHQDHTGWSATSYDTWHVVWGQCGCCTAWYPCWGFACSYQGYLGGALGYLWGVLTWHLAHHWWHATSCDTWQCCGSLLTTQPLILLARCWGGGTCSLLTGFLNMNIVMLTWQHD